MAEARANMQLEGDVAWSGREVGKEDKRLVTTPISLGQRAHSLSRGGEGGQMGHKPAHKLI